MAIEMPAESVRRSTSFTVPTNVAARAALVVCALCAGCSAAPRGSAHSADAAEHTDAAANIAPVSSVSSNAREREAEASIDDARPSAREAGEDVLEIDVPRHRRAIVVAPRDRSSPRPLIVATHGAGGTAEGACDAWRAIARGRAFVLCPRGAPIDPRTPEATGYFYPTHLALAREVEAAMSALSDEFGDDVDRARAVFAGFSQGAIMGALFFFDRSTFARAALVEGGFADWNAWSARRFRARGGERVLLVCGTRWCADGARPAAKELERAGVGARFDYARGAGHTPGGDVFTLTERDFDWLVDDDPRFGT